MYLTAQHVHSPVTHGEAINVLWYTHGGDAQWLTAPAPETWPGVLLRSWTPLPPGGNRVRSYLDIIAPDTLPWAHVRQTFVQFLMRRRGPTTPMPWVDSYGPTTIRAAVEPALWVAVWSELPALYRALESFRMQP